VPSATEPPQKSKPKKLKTRDEIDLAARKIEENKKPGSKYHRRYGEVHSGK
jgi:hypothetical protein